MPSAFTTQRRNLNDICSPHSNCPSSCTWIFHVRLRKRRECPFQPGLFKHGNASTFADTHSNTCAHSNTDTNSNAYTNTDTNSNAYTCAHTNTNTNTDSNAYTHTDSNSNSSWVNSVSPWILGGFQHNSSCAECHDVQVSKPDEWPVS
jgi:hypothetical protein